AGQQMAISGSLAFPVGRMDAGMNRYSQTSKDLANKASAIYESMVRSGITPDFNEIVSALSDKEISRLLEQNKTALGVVGTAASFIPIGRGISLAGKGTIKGLDKILTKYPRFSKWLASKGIGRTMQQLPKVEKVGSSVS